MTPNPNGIYVASSWRNDRQPLVVAVLRHAGFDVYDFKHPKPDDDGFHWSEVMPSARYEGAGVAYESVPAEEFALALEHPTARKGFASDFDAMHRSGICVLVLPCNKSAHLELGWFAGEGRRTAILLEDKVTPELMYRMVDLVTPSLDTLVDWALQPQAVAS